MTECRPCRLGRCDRCTGVDGPMTTHPDGLPLCTHDHDKNGGDDATE